MGSDLYRRTLDDECMTCGWSSLGGGPHEGCTDPNVWTEESYSPATTADHIADLVALPPAERVARLVALLRAVPEEAVEAADGCKVARAWKDGMRERLNDVSAGCLSPVAHAEEAAHGETDAALLADGWVLAGRVTP